MTRVITRITTLGAMVEKVKRAVENGISFGTAVKENLGVEVRDFCLSNGLIRQEFSAMLNGKRVPDQKQLAALMSALEGTKRGWLDLWFRTAQQKVAAGAAR